MVTWWEHTKIYKKCLSISKVVPILLRKILSTCLTRLICGAIKLLLLWDEKFRKVGGGGGGDNEIILLMGDTDYLLKYLKSEGYFKKIVEIN